MSKSDVAPAPAKTTEAKLAELEQCCTELSQAVLQLHAVIETHEKTIAKLELQVRELAGGNRPPTDPEATTTLLRQAAEISNRVAKRR